jgi:uncharacterized Fe-S cluster protein YjdI
MSEQEVHRHHPAAAREYRSDHIVIRWYPELCIHVANCLRQLPNVFDNEARPWVNVTGASADEIAQVINACPSGALRYDRLDGGLAEEVPETTTVFVQPDGPYHIRGKIEIIDSDRGTEAITRATLCRCGASENKPYCDMSHRLIRFKASS